MDRQIPWDEIKRIANERLIPVLWVAPFHGEYFVYVQDGPVTFHATLLDGEENYADFETHYKPVSTKTEATRARIVTCKAGRKLNSRFISFSTCNSATFDNTDSNGVDFEDTTYWLRDINGVLTTDTALAVATVVDFMPSYDYEVAGGLIFIPDTLPGDQDEWEIHAIGAPDFAHLGKHVNFVANNRIKWLKGQHLSVDASLNPAEISGALSPLARKIRFVMLHPQGAEAEFQINIKIFK